MELDLLPLHSVMFPYQKLPLRVFENRYIPIVADCYRNSQLFGICLIKEGTAVGPPAIPYKVGTAVKIERFRKISNQLLSIVVEGQRRFAIERLIHEQPYIRVAIKWLDGNNPQFPGDYAFLRGRVEKLMDDLAAKLELQQQLTIPQDDNDFLGMLGTIFSGLPQIKQKIIELPATQIIPAMTNLVNALMLT